MSFCTCHSTRKGMSPLLHRGGGLAVNRVIQLDPTRTTTLRRAFMAAMYKRFRWLKGQITQTVVQNDVFGLQNTLPRVRLQAVPETRAFVFKTASEKVESFMAWLREAQDEGILEVTTRTGGRPGLDQRWTDTYVRRAYDKGVDRGRTELEKVGIEMGPVEGVFRSPAHADRLGMLYTRTFSELKGITEAMDQQISRVLAEGLASGHHPSVIARALNNRVDKIGITRARTLARTEVIRAHHSATIAEYRAAGLTEGKVKAEWLTAGFNVCPICADMEGKIFTLDKMESMIPAHPNCRCCALPVLPEGAVEEVSREPSIPEDVVASRITDSKMQEYYLQQKQHYTTFFNQEDISHSIQAFHKESKIGATLTREEADAARVFREKVVRETEDMHLQVFWGDKTIKSNVFDTLNAWQSDASDTIASTWRTIGSIVERPTTVKYPEYIKKEYITKIKGLAKKKEQQKAYLRFRAMNQAYMERLGVKNVELYRGTDGDVGKMYARMITEEGSARNKFYLEDNALSGYSSNKYVANTFGIQRDGVTIRATISVEDIVVHRDLLMGQTMQFATEEEFIVVGTRRSIPLKDVATKTKPF